ncbi:MAG: EamA family transporter [Chloroflexota bacterium]|nr:EamA family transporter [Chloroflexota bacterium]
MSTSEPIPPPSPQRAPITVDLALVGMAFIWGINFAVVKTALAELSPLAFNALRFSLASLLIMVALWLVEGNIRPAPGDGWRFLVLGLVGNAGYQFLFINGLHRTTSGNGSLILATIPIFVSLIGALLRIERTGTRAWIGISFSFVGIALIVVGSGEEVGLASETTVGNLMILSAASLWAVNTILSRPVLARYSPLKVTTLSMSAGTPFIVLYAIPALREQNWGAISWQGWAGLAFSAVLGIALAYVVWNLGVSRVGGARTAIYNNLTPVVAALTGWLFLGEAITPWVIGGAALIFTGIYLTRSGRSQTGM